MSIFNKISEAKLQYRLKNAEEPTHVIMSQSDYDELWQGCVNLISNILVQHKGLKYAINSMPRFMEMYNGLIPVVTTTPMTSPIVLAPVRSHRGDTIKISDLLKREAGE